MLMAKEMIEKGAWTHLFHRTQFAKMFDKPIDTSIPVSFSIRNCRQTHHQVFRR